MGMAVAIAAIVTSILSIVSCVAPWKAKWAKAVVTLVASSTIVLTIIFLPGLKERPQFSCIMPPEEKVDSERQHMLELIVTLEKLKSETSEGQLKSQFEDILKVQYDRLNDNHKALLLFLRAIECYLQHGTVGAELAKELTQLVRSRWGARAGVSGVGAKLTPLEAAKIDESAEAVKIRALLRARGFE